MRIVCIADNELQKYIGMVTKRLPIRRTLDQVSRFPYAAALPGRVQKGLNTDNFAEKYDGYGSEWQTLTKRKEPQLTMKPYAVIVEVQPPWPEVYMADFEFNPNLSSKRDQAPS